MCEGGGWSGRASWKKQSFGHREDGGLDGCPERTLEAPGQRPQHKPGRRRDPSWRTGTQGSDPRGTDSMNRLDGPELPGRQPYR